MSGVHKHPTISFRVSDREREMIEAKILASGMQKKDYFVRSCIYNRICVVGKKEVIYQLVEELQNMQTNLSELVKQLGQQEVNFYGGGGSKLNETARSYKMLSQEADTIDGFTFVWFTDGIGWKSARGNLRETFEVLDTIYSIDDMENGIMLELFL